MVYSKFYYQLRAGQISYFYQAANIGGDTGLRGYRVQVTGDKSFVASDLKYQFNIKTNIVPLNFGGILGMIVVWLNEHSKNGITLTEEGFLFLRQIYYQLQQVYLGLTKEQTYFWISINN